MHITKTGQNSITGTAEIPNAKSVKVAVERAVSSKDYDPNITELAFFGGSFTAIDRDYMLELLDAAKRMLDQGFFKGIRISTRPDCIDDEILALLKDYGVTAIELGAQSMCDDVLIKNRRGHTVDDVLKASELIKKHGFSLGLQMMTGLYGSDEQKDRQTAEAIINIKPDTVRIYPTVILKGTLLERYYNDGSYTPPSLDCTVSLCAELLTAFENADINVIRLGLHSIENDTFVAGGWHPSLGELCKSRIFLKTAKDKLSKLDAGRYILKVNPKNVSKMIGNKRENLKALEDMGYICKVISDSEVQVDEIISERENDSCF